MCRCGESRNRSMTYREMCRPAWGILPDEPRQLTRGATRSHTGPWRLAKLRLAKRAGDARNASKAP
jgi:hypothetical protein